MSDSPWPPRRRWLHQTTLEILSLHNCPKRGEQRPMYAGTHSAAHQYLPELSGTASAPNALAPARMALSFSLHSIGGLCAVSRVLPLPKTTECEIVTDPRNSDAELTFCGGLNIQFNDQHVHCIAAEPHETFLRVSVHDDKWCDIAYEVVVLGRLRGGYRVVQLRGRLGTRIELCCLLVRISFGGMKNRHYTPRESEELVKEQSKRIEELEKLLVKGV